MLSKLIFAAFLSCSWMTSWCIPIRRTKWGETQHAITLHPLHTRASDEQQNLWLARFASRPTPFAIYHGAMALAHPPCNKNHTSNASSCVNYSSINCANRCCHDELSQDPGDARIQI